MHFALVNLLLSVQVTWLTQVSTHLKPKMAAKRVGPRLHSFRTGQPTLASSRRATGYHRDMDHLLAWSPRLPVSVTDAEVTLPHSGKTSDGLRWACYG